MNKLRIYLCALTMLIGAIVYPMAHNAAKIANAAQSAQMAEIERLAK